MQKRLLSSAPQLISMNKRTLRRAAKEAQFLAVTLLVGCLMAGNARAATYYWDGADNDPSGNNASTGAGLGGNGVWDTVTPAWWDGVSADVPWVNSFNNFAVFTGAPGIGTPYNVELAQPIQAGGLNFMSNGYTLTDGDIVGNTLTLGITAPNGVSTVNVGGFYPGYSTRINATIAGTSGLTKTGNGTLILGSSVSGAAGSNTYSGFTVINAGNVVIFDQSDLGTSNTAVAVNGFSGFGFTGGTLTLSGSYKNGDTFSRDLTLSGRGINTAGAALVSIGSNVFTGNIQTASNTETRIATNAGTTVINGNLIEGNGQTVVFYGAAGNVIINGVVAGTGAQGGNGLVKTQSGIGSTLWLTNNQNTFSSDIRLDGNNSASNNSTLRVTEYGALGVSTSTSHINFNTGMLELRVDPTNIAGFSALKMATISNSGFVFVDHGLSGSAINQTVAFGDFAMTANRNLTVVGRNGYGASFTGAGGTFAVANTGGNVNYINSSNGLMTLIGNVAAAGSTETTTRAVSLGGNADIVVTGSILAGSATGAHGLIKNNQGIATIQGTASTFIGGTNINGGTLQVSNFGALNDVAGGVLAINNAAFSFTGNAGATTAKVLNLSGTTSGGVVLANQTSGTLVFSSGVAAGGVGAKNLFLGGSGNGEIQGVIQSSSGGATNIVKIGSGTWLYNPNATTYAAGNVASAATAATGGTNSTTITLSSSTVASLGLVVGQTVSGTGVPAGAVITSITGPNTFTISISTGTTAVSGNLAFGAVTGFTGTVTVSNGTLQIKPTAAAGNGSDLINNTTGNIIFNADSLTLNQTAGGTLEYIGLPTGSTETVGSLTATAGAGTVKVTPGASGTTSLIFSSLGTINTGTGLNFEVPVNGSVSITGLATGFVNAHAYFNGADFAYSNAGVIGAATYGVTAGFVTSNTALTASAHNEITGSFSTAGMAINSLKINGAQTLTLDPGATLTVGVGGVSGGILATGGSSVITGGTGITTGNSTDLVIRVNTVSDTLTLGSAITSSSSGGVTKNGFGTLVMSVANAYTGTTTINEGIVQLTGTGNLGAANNGLMVRQGGTLSLNGVNVGVAAFNGAGTINNGSATTAATFTMGNNNQGGVFSGLLADGGAAKLNVTKTATGAGTINYLTNSANTYSGVTTISGGILAVTSLANIGQASSIGTGDVANNAGSLVFNGGVSNGGVLQYTGSSTAFQQATGTPTVSIDRLFTMAGNGTIESSGTYGNSVLAGGVSNHATLIFNNTGDIAFSGTGARTLTLGGTSQGDNRIDLHLIDNPNGGALNIAKTGAGLWVLGNGANIYTGTTTVSGGILRGVDGASLSAGSALVLSGGVFETSGTFTRSVAATATAGAVTWTTNGGFSASDSKLTVSLGGVGTPTPLTWASGGFMTGGGALILSSATALAETEFVNNINLGTTSRTIQVDQNVSTYTDFAVVSGVLTSASTVGGITKTGNGVLYLTGANEYTGATNVNQGTLVITSIGHSDVGAGFSATSSIGSGEFATASALNIGSGGNTGYVLYAGEGETTDRRINLAGTTGGAVIDNSGAGALVITNMGHTGSGSKTLTLRGTNADSNLVTSNLADLGGALNVTKSDGGTWILSGDNTYTGNTTVNSGWLGLTSTHAVGTSIGNGAGFLDLQNGGIFGVDGDLTLANTVRIASNQAALFTGNYSITFTSQFQGVSGNPWTVNNTLASGETLTFNGFTSLDTGTTRTLNFQGTGNTVVNGVISNSTGAGLVNLVLNTSGTVTLSGATPNTFTNGVTLNQGTLVLGKVDALGPSGTVTLNGGTLTASVALVGATDRIKNAVRLNDVAATIAGTNSIEFGGVFTNDNGNRLLLNNLSGGASLIFSNTVNLSQDGTSRIFQLGGSGNTLITGAVVNGSTSTVGELRYVGTGTLTLQGVNTFGGALNIYDGTVVMNGAGSLTAASSATVNVGGTLTLDNSGGEAARLAGRVVTLNGGTFNFITDGDGTTETMGALNVNSVSSVINMSGAGPGTLNFTQLNLNNTGSFLDLTNLAGLGVTNKIFFTGTAPGLTNGIITRIGVAGGTEFATYNATDGITALAAGSYNTSNNIMTALAADNMKITASSAITGPKTINSLLINGTGLNVSGPADTVSGLSNGANLTYENNTALTVSSGGILVTGGSNTISAPVVAFGGAIAVVQVNTGASLAMDGAMIGTNGFSKTLGGTLSLNTKNFITSTHNLVDGTLVLNGGLNTLFQNQALTMDANTILDLNGNVQFFATVSTPLNIPDSGGIITSNAGTGTLVTNNTGSSFGGFINGAVNFVRANANTMNLENVNTYTGFTYLTGGTILLESNGALANTSEIHLNAGGLQIGNNSNLTISNNNRVNDGAELYFRGGTLHYTGGNFEASTETFGDVSLLQGANTFTINGSGQEAYYSADVYFGALTRADYTTANFTSNVSLGSVGSNARVYFTSTPALTSTNILGSWAVVNSGDWAAYNNTQGVGAVGAAGYELYDLTFGSGNLTNLIAAAANLSTNLTAANTVTARLRLSGGFTNDVTFSAGTNVLNLEEGGLLRSNNNNASTIGTTASRGVLTAGGTTLLTGTTELVAYNAQNTMTIHSVITDTSIVLGTGNAKVALVKSGTGTLSLTAQNNYSGGTFVDQGTLTLNGVAGTVVIPTGGLTISGSAGLTGSAAASTVTMVGVEGQIAATNDVTLKGQATLTLVGTNTLKSLTFDNYGGIGNPTVNVGTLLTLTDSAAITASSSNVGFVNTITQGTLNIGSGTKTFAIDGIKANGVLLSTLTPTLNIASLVTGSATINKTGDGVLQLSNASNNFTGGINLSGGGLLISGGNSNPTSGGGGIISGPLGTGTLTVSGGAVLLVDASRTIANNIVFNTNPIFDSTINTAATLTLNGMITLPNGNITIDVLNAALTVSMLGDITNWASITGITKNGPGNLILSADRYTGGISINGNGTLFLFADGNGRGDPETLVLGPISASGVVPNVTIGRDGSSLPLNQAANKTFAPSSFTGLQDGITLTNLNGYGLQVSNAVTFNSGAIINVANYTASNLVQGLTLNGVLSGSSFTKTGAGVVVLGNALNDFTGNITITGGVVSVASDGALGNAANGVILNVNSGTNTGLRATGTFATSRVITLNQAANAIEVSAGNTLTLNTAFAFAAATNALTKNDNGTLVLAVANSAWNGVLTVNDGVVVAQNATSLGSTTGNTVLNPSNGIGAAVQIDGGAGISIAENFALAGSGIESTGALRSTIGNNTLTGSLTLTGTTYVGVDSGSTLNVNASAITGAQTLVLTGGGTGFVNSIIGTGAGAVTKLGTGTWTLTADNTYTGATAVNNGTLILSGLTGRAAGSSSFTLNQGGTLTLDNTVANPTTVNRLGLKAVTLAGGTLNFIANAGGTTEGASSTAALTLNSGASTINMTGGAGTLNFGSLVANNGSSLDLNIAGLGTTNKITFTTAPTLSPATTGIISRVTVGGVDFATYNATNGLIAFTGYNVTNNLNTAAATDTMKITANTTLDGSKTVNALNITGNGITVTGNGTTTLTLTSGGVLVTGGTNTLSIPILNMGGAGGVFHVNTGSVLNMGSAMIGSNGFTKALGGTMNLTAKQYTAGTTTVNTGTLRLSAGLNSIFQNQSLVVNNGGILDLNGQTQWVGNLSTNSAIYGGTINNSAGGTATLVVNTTGDSTFAGTIAGNVDLIKSGGAIQNLNSDNTYSGDTTVTGGRINLRDNGRLSDTDSITLNYGGLYMDNSSLYDNTNRVADDANITMNGGTLALIGRTSGLSSEDVGTVLLNSGTSAISATTGSNNGNYVQESILTLNGLSRNAATGATVGFAQIFTPNSTGQLGTLQTSQESIIINGYNVGMLTNNIMGPWAVVNTGYFNTNAVELATYNNTYGVGALGAVGMANYDYSLTNTLTGSAFDQSQNVRLTVSVATPIVIPTGGMTVNSLNVLNATASVATNLAFAAGGDTLNLAGGALMVQNLNATASPSNIGTQATPGILTAGGAADTALTDFYLYYYNVTAANPLTIFSQITDNGSEDVRMIFWGGNWGANSGTPTIVLANANNNWSGGTVVNGEQIDIGNATVAGNLVGNGLTINNGIVRQVNGTIASQDVTLVGSSTLTLLGNNTLESLTFNNIGGSGTPTVTPTGILTLSDATAIVATSNNVTVTSTIGAGTIDLGAGTKTFDIDSINLNGVVLSTTAPTLIINSVLTGSGTLNKTGTGVLQLGGQSTYSGNINLNGGGIMLAASSTTTQGGPGFVSGPLGTATLNVNSGMILIDGSSRTVANNIVFNTNPVFDSTATSAVTLTLNGTITLPTGAVTINVINPNLTVVMANAIANAASVTSITKTGLGNLSLNAAGFGGDIVFNGSGQLSLLWDGDGTGSLENLTLGNVTFDTGITPNILVGRAASTLPYTQAANKTITVASINSLANGITLTNNNGYGLIVNGNTTFNTNPIINVATATNSYQVQGLYLNGVLSGNLGTLTKTGAGTVVLGNSANNFVGLIDITNGAVSVASDGALGDAANQVRLNNNTVTLGHGFRSTGTFTTARTFILNQANNAFEVTQNNTLTLTTAFTLGAVTNALVKNDNGVLELAAANNTWTGNVTINAGAVRVSDANALGNSATGSTTVVNTVGAALQLNGVTLNALEVVNLNNTGINTGGALQAVGGTASTVSALVLQAATAIGADAGSTLNVTGTVSGGQALTLAGAGTINFTTTALGTGISSITKINSGTTNLSVASTGYVGNITVNAGTFAVNGLGSIGGTGSITINTLGAVNVNYSAAATQRLGGRAMTLQGGELTLTGATATTLESLGALTVNKGLSVITVDSAAGITTGLTFSGVNNVSVGQTTGPTGGTVLFNLSSAGTENVILTNASYSGQVGNAAATNKGVLPWAIVNDGTTVSFGTTSTAANAGTATLRTLASTEYVNNTVTGNNNVLLTNATTNMATSQSINSLTFGTGAVSTVALTLGANQTLQNQSGGILVRANTTASISGGIVNYANNFSPLTIWTYGDLNISSLLSGGNGQASGTIGLVKAGTGTLTLSSATSAAVAGMSQNLATGQVVINQGTVRLAGGTNTLAYNNFLSIQDSGVLDLNGNNQMTYSLFNDVAYANGGGTLTNSNLATESTYVANMDQDRNFSGAITGNLAFQRAGRGTYNMYSDNTYSGATYIMGTTSLRDEGRLSNTSSITIGYANLNLQNDGTLDLNNRIADDADITMYGGTLFLQGRAQMYSTEDFADLTIVEGAASIQVNNGNANLSAAQITFDSLTRLAGSTVNFTGSNLGGLGQIDRGSRILFDTAPVLTSNGVMGAWAIANVSDYATYTEDMGVGAVGANGFRIYDTTLASGNITNLGANLNLTAASTVTGMLRLSSGSNQDITFSNASNVLNLEQGGLLRSNTAAAATIGTTATRGILTAGGNATTGTTELIVYNNQNTVTINSVIVDTSTAIGSGSANVTFMKSGAGTVTLTAQNSYTGGTIVNQGTLNLNGAAGVVVIPAGELVVSNSTLTMLTNSGQINSAANITIQGNGLINYVGNNTVTGLVTFENNGGAPRDAGNGYGSFINLNGYFIGGTLNSGGVLTLTGGIVANSTNAGTVATVAGRVDFGATNQIIDVAPILVNGDSVAPLMASLALQSIVGTTGGFTKIGDGTLQLNAASFYTGDTVVNDGTLLIGNFNAGSKFSELVIGAGASVNLSGMNGLFGSLSGSGYVFNSSQTTASLVVGFDNTNSTFGGNFVKTSDATPTNLGLTKIGNGKLTMTGVANTTNDSTGTLSIQKGTVEYSGAGTAAFKTFSVLTNGVLTLDNSASTVNNRLNSNASGTLNMSGGIFNFIGNTATATTEVITSLTLANGQSRLNIDRGNAGGLVTATNLTAVQTGGTAILSGAGLRVTNMNIAATQGGGANGTTTMSIRADMLYDASPTGGGTAFVTRDSGASQELRGLTAAEMAAAPGGVFAGTGGNTVNYSLASTATMAVDASVNSLTLQSGGGVALSTPVSFGVYEANGSTAALTINSGGVLAFAGNTGISAGQILSNTHYNFWTVGAATELHVAGSLTSGQPITKSGDGTMFLDSKSYATGQTTVNGGNLVLNGGKNTLQVTNTAGVVTAYNLAVNSGTVNLNGNSQIVASLFNNNPLANSGGTVTNTSGTFATLETITGGATFSGHIDGNINLNKWGNGTMLLTASNGYEGNTIVGGGTLQLRDDATILNTDSIRINFAGLFLDNSGIQTTANITRLSADTEVYLTGGSLTLQGEAMQSTFQNLDSVTVNTGQNTFSLQALYNQSSSVVLSIDDLIVTNKQSAVNFNAFVGAQNGLTVNAGGIGGTGFNSSQVLIGTINGSAITLTNGLIGGWAVANGDSFASYNATTGVVALPAYDFTDLSAAGVVATSNVNDSSARTITGVKNLYSLRTGAGTAYTITLSTASSLNFGVGYLQNGNVATTIQGADATSTVSGTGTDLYFYMNQNTLNINAKITGSANFVKTGGAAVVMGNPTTTAGSSNDYTGTTYVLGGTLTLSKAAGLIAIPGDLVVTNSTVTMNAQQGQIAATSNVTINGGGTVNLTGTNSLASLTFNNTGGNGNGTVQIGGSATTGTHQLTLTAANAITAVNDNYGFTPVISPTSGGSPTGTYSLVLSNAAPVINVSGSSTQNLLISAAITSAGGVITKTGSGALILNNATSTFTTGINLAEGTLIIDASSTPTTGTVTSGPLGTGALTIGDETTIMAGTAGRTLANLVNVAGDFTFGGSLSQHNLTLSNTVTLAAGAHNINVAELLVTATISGQLTGGTNLTKSGRGTLILSNATNNFGGSTTVAEGSLRLGATNAVTSGSALTVNQGASFDVAGFAQTVGSLSGGTLTTGGQITNSGAAQTLTTGTDNTDTTFAGVITNGTNALSLTKVGNGVQTLSGINTYAGRTTVTGGAISISSENNIGLNPAAFVADHLLLNGGRLQTTATFSIDDTNRGITLGASGGGFETAAATTLTVSNVITGGGSLTKTGDGVMVTNRVNTYTGATNVNAGTLQVGLADVGTIGTAAATTTVAATGTLAGSGTVVGTVNVTGKIAPGDLAGAANGSLDITGSLSVAETGVIELGLGTRTYFDSAFAAVSTTTTAYQWLTGAGSGEVANWRNPTSGTSDLLDVSGALTIDGFVNIVTGPGYNPATSIGDVFYLVDWATATTSPFAGNFNAGTGGVNGGVLGDFVLPSLGAGGYWDTSAFTTYGVIAVVAPEPGRMMLLLVGLCFLVMRRRRA